MSLLPQNFPINIAEMHLTACTAVLDVAVNYDTVMFNRTNKRYYSI